MNIRLELTETIPAQIEEGVLYVSFKYWTTAHKCGCGCGQKVVLRLSPKHWAITLNGDSVSMYPSVGNWQLPCKSHYWIEEGQIVPARQWSDVEIQQNRILTKGKRTPFQTPHSREQKLSDFDTNAENLTQQREPCWHGESGHRLEEIDESSDEIQCRGRQDKGTTSFGWLKVIAHRIDRNWSNLLHRFRRSRSA